MREDKTLRPSAAQLEADLEREKVMMQNWVEGKKEEKVEAGCTCCFFRKETKRSYIMVNEVKIYIDDQHESNSRCVIL
jgi:hypothetical protein